MGVKAVKIVLPRMKRNCLITAFFILCSLLKGQNPVGTWSDHLVYNSVKYVAVSDDNVYASTGSSILVYNKEFGELKKLSPVTGLSETGISSIAWAAENRALIIAYVSANLDILIENTFYNIPDINRKYIPGRKVINRIRTNGRFAYLMSSFGIVVIDIPRKEIRDTWKPGPGIQENETWDIAFLNNKIYAATEAGIFTADISDQGLSYYGNWSPEVSLTGRFTSVISAGARIYANKSESSGDLIFVMEPGITPFTYPQGLMNLSLDQDIDGGGFTVASPGAVRHYNNNGVLLETITGYGSGTPGISHAVADEGIIWIADNKTGLIRYQGPGNFTILSLPGPVSNDIFHVYARNGKVLLSGGGANVSWTQIFKPLQVSVFENNTWSALTSNTLYDAMRAIVDPENSDRIFVATWGGGLLEYENNELKNRFTYTNSPLQTIIPNQEYVRICGMAFDRTGNLWMSQTQVPGSIKALKPGTPAGWIVNPVTIESATIGDLIITQSGYKWIVLPRGTGIFVLDDNKTPENFNDDRSKLMIIKDTENKIIPVAHSVAEDLDGNIWIGTDEGPLVYYNSERVFNEDLKASRIKVPRNDGSGLADYVLSTESIRSIAVDGANRKWLGTNNSGAYLLSEDGVTVVRHFNEQNSPIFSNDILSLAVDNKTGMVWFATSKGVLSFRGDATEGRERFSGVYAFPNPVRQDFTGNVTITGLIRDSGIRITDISGNLVYKTQSRGGEASWDLKTYNGKRVATGVYLIFCSSNDGTESFVTKMLVIK